MTTNANTTVAAEHALARFGAAVHIAMHRAAGKDLDAHDMEQLALKYGVLVWVNATEPCGEGCVCARIMTLHPNIAFPQECLTAPDAIREAVYRLTSEVSQ